MQNLPSVISVNVSFSAGLTGRIEIIADFCSLFTLHWQVWPVGDGAVCFVLSPLELGAFAQLCSSLGALRWHCQDSDVQLCRSLLALLSHLL